MDDKKPYQGTRARKRQRLVVDANSDTQDGNGQGESLAANSSEDAKPELPPRGVPLSCVVDPFIKPRDSRAPVHWRALRRLLFLLTFGSTNSDQQDPMIVGALDRPQKSALAILKEWWTGNPHDTILPKIKYTLFLSALGLGRARNNEIFKDRLTALKNLASDKDLTFLDHVAWVQGLFFTADKRHDDSLESIQLNFDDFMENVYHRNMIQLFHAEFYPGQDPSEVNESRDSAGSAAADEGIGFHALLHVNSIMGNSTPASIAFSSTTHQLKLFSRPISRVINPCHWLENREVDGLPFYLWDIRLGCTVRTTDICRTHIRYAIVSHTWGQFRDKKKMEPVVGVPWLVPKIRRYDVKELPRIIRDAGFSEPYLWLDLFCIPQETKKKSHLEILNAELPRQLAIFRNASTVVMWLNDVTSWDNTTSAIAWIGLEVLIRDSTNTTRYQDLCSIESALDIAAKSALCSCDLVLFEENERIKPPAWFESLWTLQEITIRPDMVFLDKDWRPLTIGNTLLVALDSLSSLVGEVGDVDGSPKGAATLISVRGEYISLLAGRNRLDPMAMGARRFSTSPRAPAIMSAVGATNWFHGRTLQQFQTPEEESELVLESYPLDFVEEVRDLSGAAFFSCWTNVATLVLHDNTGMEPIP
ncbi:hypothetical protein BJX65DRAFT_311121 [Aspergillus insuetus]